MREKLIELIKCGIEEYQTKVSEQIKQAMCKNHRYNSKTDNIYSIEETIADYLLQKGVVVLPCKVGDTVYEIIEDAVPTQHCYVEGYEVQDVSVNAVKYADDWNQFDYPNLYFTKEEAKKALERSRQ